MPPLTTLHRRSLDDIEDIYHGVGGANLRGVQLGRHIMAGQSMHLVSPGIIFTNGLLDANMRTVGEVDAQRVLMAVLLNEEGDIFSFIAGRNVMAGEVFVIPPGGVFDNRSVGPIHYATISIEHGLLRDIAGKDTMVNGHAWLEQRHVFRASPARRFMLCQKIAELSSLVPKEDSHYSGLQVGLLQRQLLEVFLEGIVFDEQGRAEHCNLSEFTLVRRAEEWMEAHGSGAVLLADMCKALNVSRRTLQRAYTNTLGMGPARYLMLKRLSAVRRILKLADPATTSVSAVALQYGFWELGRFAVQYKRLFGERPSDTLNKRAKLR